MSNLKITRIEVHEFGFDLKDMAKEKITAVGNIGSKAGYNTRRWTKHGKLPYVDYTGASTGGLRRLLDVASIFVHFRKTT